MTQTQILQTYAEYVKEIIKTLNNQKTVDNKWGWVGNKVLPILISQGKVRISHAKSEQRIEGCVTVTYYTK